MTKQNPDHPPKPAPAPLPGEVENLIWTFRCDLRRATPGDVSEMLLTLVNADDLHKAINLITDLQRRLAEAEAAYKHVKQCLYISQGRAKRAEERIQELEDMRND